MVHVFIAVVIQLLTHLFGFDIWIGAAAGAWYFIGREYTQAEYRLIEHYYGGKRSNLPFLAPLREARGWDKKAILDWVMPTAVVCAIAVGISRYFE